MTTPYSTRPEKFEELSQSGKRFSLFALTVDTHHPDGFISRTCERKRYDVDGKKNLSFSAVSCSQEHIAALIEKIKASPYFKTRSSWSLPITRP